jgi:hypothetical protein
MSENDEVVQNLPLNDGFDGYENDNIQGEEQKTSSSNRIIHGHRLSFTIDYKWLVDDDKEFPKTGALIAIETRVPMGHIFLAPDAPWPNVDGMNTKCPKSEWGEYQGKAQGPWQRQRLVYFVDENTMQKYTWPSRVETIGADICVREFREKVQLMRRFRGECVYAVVALRDTYMSTRFGGRQRPDLVPVRWIKLGPSEAALPTSTTPVLPSPDVKAQSDQPIKMLISADFASVEPRVLCWLAGETWKLDAFRKFDATGDLAFENYCMVATKVLHRTVTPEDEEGRQIGKYMELAFGYGGALGAFRKIAPDADFNDAQVETFKKQWRAAHPKITKFWAELHRVLLRRQQGQCDRQAARRARVAWDILRERRAGREPRSIGGGDAAARNRRLSDRAACSRRMRRRGARRLRLTGRIREDHDRVAKLGRRLAAGRQGAR